eukprot:Selendium_serpulae@DN4857_c0_g1_i1.p1
MGFGRFRLGALLRGMGVVAAELFGVRIDAAAPKTGEVWHPSVLKFTLHSPADARDATGVLYLDLLSRAHKEPLTAQFTVRCSKDVTGSSAVDRYDGSELFHKLRASSSVDAPVRQTPCAALVCSLAAPRTLLGRRRPLLEDVELTLNQATALFHELGHALHCLLSRTHFQHLSGSRGPVNFVEFPSHLFENFITDERAYRYLSSFGDNNGPREALDSDYAVRRQQRNLFGGLSFASLLVEALADQAVHRFAACRSDGPRPAELRRFVRRRVFEHPALARVHPGTSSPVADMVGIPLLSNFSHLIHYGGCYYTYPFNKCVAQWVWQSAFSESVFPPTSGKKLLQLLQQGSLDTTLTPILELLRGLSRQEKDRLIANPDQLPLTPILNELRDSSALLLS